MKLPAAIRDFITRGRKFHFDSQLRAQQRDRFVSRAADSGHKQRPVRDQEQAHVRR